MIIPAPLLPFDFFCLLSPPSRFTLLHPYQHPKQIIKAEGMKGLYKGVVPRLGRVIPGQGIIFMSYERIQTFVAGIVEGTPK